LSGLQGCALRAARTDPDDVFGDDLDRGDGVETDGGHEPPTVVDRLEEASKQLRLARSQADKKWDEAAIGTSARHVDETLDAIRELRDRDAVDRGDGIETDGGRDSPQGALRITLDRDDIMSLLDDGTKLIEKDVGPITVNLRTHQRFEPAVLVAGRRKDPDPERVDDGGTQS